MAPSAVSNHNPTPNRSSHARVLPQPGADNASSSTSTVTLGRPGHTSRGTSTYNLDRFLEQDMFDDANLHGRVPEHTFRPRPKTFIKFYKAKAANAIDDFNAAFEKASGSGSGGQ